MLSHKPVSKLVQKREYLTRQLHCSGVDIARENKSLNYETPLIETIVCCEPLPWITVWLIVLARPLSVYGSTLGFLINVLVRCHWGGDSFSDTFAQVVFAECDQPVTIPWQQPGLEPEPRRGQVVRYTHSPTMLSWLIVITARVIAGWNELLIASFSHRSMAVKDGILLATGLHVHRSSAHTAGVGTIFDRVLTGELTIESVGSRKANSWWVLALNSVLYEASSYLWPLTANVLTSFWAAHLVMLIGKSLPTSYWQAAKAHWRSLVNLVKDNSNVLVSRGVTPASPPLDLDTKWD